MGFFKRDGCCWTVTGQDRRRGGQAKNTRADVGKLFERRGHRAEIAANAARKQRVPDKDHIAKVETARAIGMTRSDDYLDRPVAKRDALLIDDACAERWKIVASCCLSGVHEDLRLRIPREQRCRGVCVIVVTVGDADVAQRASSGFDMRADRRGIARRINDRRFALVRREEEVAVREWLRMLRVASNSRWDQRVRMPVSMLDRRESLCIEAQSPVECFRNNITRLVFKF